MGRLLGLLAAFVLFGWALPTWGWGLCPVLLGIAMFLAGLRSLVAGSAVPDATSGLGGVAIAFLGICVALGGLVAAGHAYAAEAVLGWINAIPESALYGGAFSIGIVLAAVARAK